MVSLIVETCENMLKHFFGWLPLLLILGDGVPSNLTQLWPLPWQVGEPSFIQGTFVLVRQPSFQLSAKLAQTKQLGVSENGVCYHYIISKHQ